MIKNLLQMFLVVSISWSASAQCTKPNQVMKADKKNGWSENSQSKSGALAPGDTYEYNFIVQRGIDYRITTLGGKTELTKGNVEFKIYDSQVQRVEVNGEMIYKRFETIVFDSRNPGNTEELIFNSPQTRKLTMRVEVVADGQPNDVHCVVVFVETRRSEKLGLR
jgi:hypothetical protein